MRGFVASTVSSASACGGGLVVVGACLGLDEGLERAGEVEDLGLQRAEVEFLEAGVHRDHGPLEGRGVCPGALVRGRGLVVLLDHLGPSQCLEASLTEGRK